MERELITSEYSYREVKIEETKIKTFSKDDRMNRSFRVYDGGYAGIQFVQGSADEDTCYKKAQDNLILKRPYKFPLETGVRHRDKTEREYSDKELMEIAREAVTHLEKNYPDIKLQKYDAYAEAKTAIENGNAAGWANDNTEVIAFAIENEGFTVGVPSLGDSDTIAPAVTKGNETLLNWLNDEIKAIGEENFFHADYEATLLDTYGADYEDTLVVEGGKVQ